jgi:hypothetical protein
MGPRLATMSHVTQEMRAIYREARAGQFDGGWAACGTAMRCLERLWFALAAGDLEARLDALEQHLNLRDARGSTADTLTSTTTATIAREHSNDPRSAGTGAAGAGGDPSRAAGAARQPVYPGRSAGRAAVSFEPEMATPSKSAPGLGVRLQAASRARISRW